MFALRVLAVAFAVVGLLYLVLPSPSLDFMSNVGELFGNHTRAPHTQAYLWLSLGFAYMVVITGICLIAQSDVVRYRPLLLLLAAGKAASSLHLARLLPPPGPRLRLPARRPGRRLADPAGALALHADREDRPPSCHGRREPPRPRRRRTTHAERDLLGDGAGHRRPARGRARRRRLRPGRRLPRRRPTPPPAAAAARPARLRVAALPAPLQPPRPAAARTLPRPPRRLALGARNSTCCCWRSSSRRSATRSPPRSRRGSATSLRCELADGPGPSPPARSATPSRAARARNATSS